MSKSSTHEKPPSEQTPSPPRTDAGGPSCDESVTPTAAELRFALFLPWRAVTLLLSRPRDLAACISRPEHCRLLLAVMLSTSVLMAVPYGLVLGPAGFWRVPVLFLASALICLPSLHIVSAYFGCTASALQSLVWSLVTTSVAALFTLAFAPILAFLTATIPRGSTITPTALSAPLLALALVAGLVQMHRCRHRLKRDGAVSRTGELACQHPYRPTPQAAPRLAVPAPSVACSWWVTLLWQPLLCFIVYRMAVLLELI